MKANSEFSSDNLNVENSIKVKFVRNMLVFSLFKAHLLFKWLVCQKCTSSTQCGALKKSDALRISFHYYNTYNQLDYLVKCISRI